MQPLPTLDFAHFLSGTPAEKQSFANALIKSFKQHGFAKLINHGLPEEMIEDLFEYNKRIFSQPPEVKSTFVNIPSNQPQRGWSWMGAETTAKLRKENLNGGSGADLTDEKEHFDIGPLNDTLYPNKWPTESQVPGFKKFSTGCYEACQKVSLQVMEAMEVGLHLPAASLTTRCKPAASELRMNYYPSVTVEKLNQGKTKRGWPHSDFGIITLLFQDQIGGLELEDRENPGTYVPIPPTPPGSQSEMIINISDTFHRWSNNQVPSGLHQVTSPVQMKGLDHGVIPERRSNVFFFKACHGTSVGPLPDFVSEKHPAEYDEITALQFHKQMTEILY